MRRESVKCQRQIRYGKGGNVPEGFGRTEIRLTQGDRSFQKQPDCTGETGKERWANRDGNKHSRCLRKVFMEYFKHKGFPGGSVGKNRLPTQATQEMRVRCLGGEDALEEEMATYSSVLAWRIPRTEEPGGLQSQTQLSDWAHTCAYRKSS